jgi:type I pantothenate kinase
VEPALYETFTRDAWRRLRASTPLTLGTDDLDELRGLNEHLSLDEVEAAYLPLSRLLNLRVAGAQALHTILGTFTGSGQRAAPYIIGMAGSVAVGKSTTARVLRALLARWPDHPKVDLVTTDGFLYPNAELERRGLMDRKGFPESYDVRRLLRFLVDVKAGARTTAPEYSHVTYDVLAEPGPVVHQPDILIVEGINVLQVGGAPTTTFVSDYFDFSIYVDADVADIRQWYVDRFLTLYDTVFQQEDSFFHRFAALGRAEAAALAGQIWQDINERNLVENILPTRERASLVLAKGPDHRVREVRLRRF